MNLHALKTAAFPGLCYLFLASGAGVALAQTAPAAPAATTTRSGEVVQLSAFEVSVDSVRGYATTSSTSASRIAVPVTELASSLITINEQLIEDVMAVSAEDVLNLVGGMSAFNDTRSQDGNGFALRGYTQTGAKRDGFDDLLFGANGGFDFAFVERLEISKGPNGSLHGEMSPGGTLNIVGKRPLARPRTKASLMLGSYNFYKADLDTSGFVDRARRFGYRLSTSYRNGDGALDHPGDSNKGFLAVNPSLRYRFANGLETWLWTGFVRDQSPRLRRLVRGFRTPDGRGGYLMSLADDPGVHNIMTNLQQVETDNYEVGATKSFEIGGVKIDGRVQARTISQLDTNRRVRTTGTGGGTDTFVATDGTILGSDSRNIDLAVAQSRLAGFFRNQVIADGNTINSESTSGAADFNLSFAIGPTRHRMLVSYDFNTAERITSPGLDGVNYTITSLPVLQSLGAEIVGNTARVWLYPLSKAQFVGIRPEKVAEVANQRTAQSITRQDSSRSGFGVNERMAAFDGRLHATLGAKYTQTKIDNQTGTAAVVKNSTNDWSTSLALLGKVYKGEKGEAALFVNAKDTFVPVFTIDRRLATDGQKFPNRTVVENEVGAKLDLLGSRVVATAAVFDKVEDNALLSEIDVDGSITGVPGRSYQAPVGERTTKGWDLDVAANLTRSLNVVLAYGRTRERLADGTPRSGRAASNWSGLARYEVQSGPFKHLSLLWQYTWWGQSRLNNRTYWVVPPGDLHTAVLGYRWRNYVVRLRVENVFDELKVRPGVNETALGVTDHRNYRFSVESTW
ncbi:MAG: TonB-dependent receptor plug domain-containing protein [Opitutaceae bacterium]|nr:TonB-dependent receptor plug domain-containing protein [Opitutaceae bacterium]